MDRRMALLSVQVVVPVSVLCLKWTLCLGVRGFVDFVIFHFSKSEVFSYSGTLPPVPRLTRPCNLLARVSVAPDCKSCVHCVFVVGPDCVPPQALATVWWRYSSCSVAPVYAGMPGQSVYLYETKLTRIV